MSTESQLAPRLSRFWQVSRPLALTVLGTTVLLLFFTVGIFLDERVITGAPAWVKPAKFAISVTVYSATMLWLLSLVDTGKRWRKRLVTCLGWVLAGTLFLEWVGIITQAVRSTTSHFNMSTPFDAAIWAMMGVAIMVLYVANFVTAWLLLTQRFDSPVFALALRLGMIITLIGLGEGYLMTSPTAQQLAGLQAGEPLTIIGAHSVGVEDGGVGLPFLNWSTEGGDLRIGHFVGMHALQIIPLLGLLIRRHRRLGVKRQLGLVWVGALTYLGLTLLVTWQALRAQPITQPDALTVGVFVGIVGAALLAAGVMFAGGQARASLNAEHV